MTTLERLKRWLGVAAPVPAVDVRPSPIDELTGLSTRAVLQERLAAALQAGATGVVVLLDVDNFKHCNDRHGHPAGHALLRAIASRMRDAFAQADCVARVGGDEFIAFLPRLALDDAMPLARRCLEAMRAPLPLAGGTEIVTVSIGVATLDGLIHDTANAVLRACDVALHAAKARRRDRVVAFDGDTREAAAPARDTTATAAELLQRHRAMHEGARTDALTGLRNRLALDELINGAAGDGEQRVQRAAVAVIDVDHFGNYNHVHGDAAGDQALASVARAIHACSREADFVFRKGGGEFVAVLPDADSDAAVAAAERVRAAVQQLALPHAASPLADVVTVTIGVASGPPGATLRQLLGAAAELAMAAKVRDQRNRVHF